jgi:hypothetical protein
MHKHNWPRFDTPCGNSSAEVQHHIDEEKQDSKVEANKEKLADNLDLVAFDEYKNSDSDIVIDALVNDIDTQKAWFELMEIRDFRETSDFMDVVSMARCATNLKMAIERYTKSCPSVIGKAESLSS